MYPNYFKTYHIRKNEGCQNIIRGVYRDKYLAKESLHRNFNLNLVED